MVEHQLVIHGGKKGSGYFTIDFLCYRIHKFWDALIAKMEVLNKASSNQYIIYVCTMLLIKHVIITNSFLAINVKMEKWSGYMRLLDSNIDNYLSRLVFCFTKQ